MHEICAAYVYVSIAAFFIFVVQPKRHNAFLILKDEVNGNVFQRFRFVCEIGLHDSNKNAKCDEYRSPENWIG